MNTRRRFISHTLGWSSLAGLTNALAMGQQPLQNGIRRMRGEVRLNGKPARLDQAVLQGDTVTTGPNSEVLYVMGAKRLETPAATIGIRGTACYLETMESQLYFCLCYGTADVQPLADRSQARSLTTRYHDTPLYIGQRTGAGSPAILPAPVINHRDLELILLEEAVGRRPPFLDAGKHTGY
jgi:hypothetical protein